MSIHIAAEKGQIAPRVLFPGDPLRAKWIAETYLSDVICYTEIRNMFGFTGTYKGERISVQGSGMGQASASIYANELFDEYDVQTLIRVGTCGALTEAVRVRDVIVAMSASTDSQMNRLRFHGIDYAPTADYKLLRAAVDAAETAGLNVHVGQVFSGDLFYNDRPDLVSRTAEYGVLGIEMEAAALYTLAAKFGRRALGIMTVSDHLITHEVTSAEERQTTFSEMITIALDAAIEVPV
ncbi:MULTISPECIES: purine-nucleoside phosphorylase [Kribbella]|jgi:purine-nucleoside phosphorylase|uniref:Uridine phosphorylase n=1 Tax=Kribbella pratensis TaxID=2512112 RepID=A0ABY2F9V2_9ACTN|nr:MULTISPECIES: purine-nucleoside phosphorylase [Kribbella]TDW87086.1 purine-nucleoside phosphorylase [Kribbella pratensis]TDW91589.1 purine-nucleoside phosphorylase [Kribbella sp. VKM Ac-2566]